MGVRTGNPTWENAPSTNSPVSATAMNNIETVLDNSVPLDTFPEEVRDAVAAALTAGANITITVNDPGDTITIAVTDLPETIRDTMASALVAGSNITITPDDGGDTITIAATIPAQPDASTTVKGIVELATTAETQTGTDAVRAITPAGAAGTYTPTTALPELIRDTMGTALVAGTNVTITVNDAGDTITIAASGGTPPDASTTVKGIVELATNAETQTGTDTVRAVTPAGGASAYISKTIINQNGELVVGSANDSAAVLPVGNAGTVLTVDPFAPRGIAWMPPVPIGPITPRDGYVILPDLVTEFGTDTGWYASTYQTLVKFTIGATIEISSMNVDVTTTDGSATGHMAIWGSDDHGLPFTLLQEVAFSGPFTFPGDTAALLPGGLAVIPGVYWVGIAVAGGTSLKLRGCHQLGVNMGISGYTSDLATNAPTWIVEGMSGPMAGGSAGSVQNFNNPDFLATAVPWITLHTNI